jgi:hypothetical protein
MDLTPEQIAEIESKLQALERLDPAVLPQPAAELVTLRCEIREESGDGG